MLDMWEAKEHGDATALPFFDTRHDINRRALAGRTG